jgi:hypothetical protein
MTGFSGHFSFSAVIYLKAVIIHFKNLYKNNSLLRRTNAIEGCS